MSFKIQCRLCAIEMDGAVFNGTTVTITRSIIGDLCRRCYELEKEKARNADLEKRLLDLGEQHKRLMGLPCAKCVELRAALEEYGQHDRDCILTKRSQGEPTPDGGYREMFNGKWYQTRPIDETPECECGFSKALSSEPTCGAYVTVLERQNVKFRAALEKLRDCDWVITLPDRMDAVRKIARKALWADGGNEKAEGEEKS